MRPSMKSRIPMIRSKMPAKPIQPAMLLEFIPTSSWERHDPPRRCLTHVLRACLLQVDSPRSPDSLQCAVCRAERPCSPRREEVGSGGVRPAGFHRGKERPVRGFLGLRGARVTAVIGFAFLCLAPVAGATDRYVALGDSFSSGVGTGSYSLSSACKRSVYAYPYLLSQLRAGTSLNFVACSGATTPDLINTELAAVTASTTIVTMTIGGNDIGFSNLIYQCTVADCSAALDSTRANLESTLGSRLDSVYAAVQRQAAATAK